MIEIKSFKQLDVREYEFEYKGDEDNDIIKLKKSKKGNGWILCDNQDLQEEELEMILKEIKKLNKSK